MQRAVVIRMHGDQNLGNAIVTGMQSQRIKDLETRLAMHTEKDSEKYRKLIESIDRRFPIREHSERYNKFWAKIGMIWLMLTEC